MSSLTLEWILVIATWGMMLSTSILARRRDQALDRSHVQFVLTSWLIVCRGLLITMSVAIATFQAVAHDLLGVAVWSLIAVIEASLLIQVLKNDDNNWFNHKWKRLKTGLKKAKARLQSVFTPAPQPAFG